MYGSHEYLESVKKKEHLQTGYRYQSEKKVKPIKLYTHPANKNNGSDMKLAL
jgi:hypothetical protein